MGSVFLTAVTVDVINLPSLPDGQGESRGGRRSRSSGGPKPHPVWAAPPWKLDTKREVKEKREWRKGSVRQV